MKLVGNIEIRFGETKGVTEETLKLYREKWRHYVRVPTINHQNFPDDEALDVLMHRRIPLTIVADNKAGPLVIDATFARFPYSIDGKYAFASYGLRFVPRCGQVKLIRLDRNCRTAINTFSMSSRRISIDLGNGSLHLEIFYRPTKNKLGNIAPPVGFQKEIITEGD